MNPKRMVIASLGDDDAVLLTEVPPADEFDFQPVLGGQPLSVLSDLLAKRLSELRVVEQADLRRLIFH